MNTVCKHFNCCSIKVALVFIITVPKLGGNGRVVLSWVDNVNTKVKGIVELYNEQIELSIAEK